jgi:ABC-type glycerol-3-phosphate transport system substrate-binding protein
MKRMVAVLVLAVLVSAACGQSVTAPHDQAVQMES